MPAISTSAALTQFRSAELGGSTLYRQLLAAACAYLLRLPVGVGKSTLIDNLVKHNLEHAGEFDLIIICAPTHRILQEREFLQDPTLAGQIKMLRGRPAERCGEACNREWSRHEKSATTTLAKRTICCQCPQRAECDWPDQFHQLSNHHKVVLLPQSYLAINPGVLMQIIQKTQASRPLIILDEANFAQESFRRSISVDRLGQFAEVVRAYNLRYPGIRSLQDYQHTLELLCAAPVSDMRAPGWYFPPLSADIAAGIQELGLEMFGERFYYLGYDLSAFSMQHPAYRDRQQNGTVVYRCLPKLGEGGATLLVLSGTVSKELLEYRLEVDFQELYGEYTFRHEGSRFYNLNLGQGVGKYHKDHLPQMVDFAVQYLMRQMRQDKTLVIVTKKSFVDPTVKQLNAALDRAFLKKVRAVPADEWRGDEEGGVLYIPVLHYGAIGFNTFEGFDSILCLAGYYIRTDELNRMVNEVSTEDVAMPFRIDTTTRPLRRGAVSTLPRHRQDPYITRLAQEVICQEELGVVIQAVGRVRPFTQPREVITCQMGEHPDMPYDSEFHSLQEAREFFGLRTQRSQGALKNHIMVYGFRFFHGGGATQDMAVQALGIKKRTVSKYWRKTPPMR